MIGPQAQFQIPKEYSLKKALDPAETPVTLTCRGVYTIYSIHHTLNPKPQKKPSLTPDAILGAFLLCLMTLTKSRSNAGHCRFFDLGCKGSVEGLGGGLRN